MQTSYNNFFGRYNADPGDMTSAFTYWGTACADTAGNCNGNGNGSIQTCLNAPGLNLKGIGESRRAYRHMSLACVIGINTPQIINSESFGSGRRSPVIRGTTHIASKVDSAMFFFQGSFNCPNHSFMLGNGVTLPWLGQSRVNSVYLARSKNNHPSGDSDGEPTVGALRPSEAFEIDQKIDDGAINDSGNFTGATTGNVRSVNGDPNNVTQQPCRSGGTFYNVSGAGSDTNGCIIGYRLN